VNEVLEKPEHNLPFPDKYYINPDAEKIRLYLHGAITTFDNACVVADHFHWVHMLAILFDFRTKLMADILQSVESLARKLHSN
jgi:hypothetical protein